MVLTKGTKGKHMKKITVTAIAGMFAAFAAHADFQGAPNPAPAPQTGGFVGGAETIVTVAQVKDMRDDVNVIVKGKILQRAGDEKYLFEDSTGSIIVEIDDKDWRGQTVTPNDTIKLYGEVDRGFLKTEIDVDYVEKM